MKSYTYPIVGISYRPPAAAKILRRLPLGAKLELLAEPTNHVDPNAIMVNFIWTGIDSKTAVRIEEALQDETTEIQEEIIMSESYHLGYIPAPLAKVMRLDRGFPETPVEAELVFPETKRGNQPHVRFTL